jgi:predicted amidophosphoribosyltransferase
MTATQCPVCGEWLDDSSSEFCPTCGEVISLDDGSMSRAEVSGRQRPR